MAFKTSENYKSVIYSGDCRHKLKLLFNGVELDDADVYCESLKVTSRIIPNGSTRFSLDNFVAKEAELVLHDIDTTIIQSPVNISIGTLVDGTYEYVPIGLFVVQDLPTTDKNKTTIKLRDYAVKFDFGYNAKDIIDENGGSVTKLQILQDICNKAGVETDITKFYGSNSKIGIYDNSITARTYISYLAEQAGAIATIDRSGKLIFVQLKDLETVEIPLNIVEKYEDGEKYEISRVVYEDAIRKFEYGDESKDTLFINTANPYITNDVLTSTLTGTQIETSDSADAELVNYKQYGITKQETTTGKNLLNVPSEYSVTGTKRVNMNMPIGSYVINWEDIITDGTGTDMLIYFYYEDGTTLSKYISPTYTSKSLSFTTAKNVNRVGIYSQENYNNSQGITTTFKKLMISTDGGTYEPYTGGQPSPSPDYPQEIEVGRGKNLLGLTDGTYTHNGITAIVSNGEISLSGTAIANSFVPIPLNANLSLVSGQYTISTNNEIANSNVRFRIESIGTLDTLLNAINKTNTITYNNETLFGNQIIVRIQSGATLSDFKFKPMIEKGSVATRYVPYNTIEAKSTGKNLLKIEKQTKVAHGITTISNEDGSLTSNGTTTGTYYELINDIICEYPSGTYTFSISKPLSHGLVLRFYFENSNKNYKIPKGSKSVNFTTTEKCNKYRIYAEGDLKIGTAINETVYPQLERGSTATDYEPYKESLITYNLGDNFLADKDYIENGVLNKHIGKVVLNGSETWSKDANRDNDTDYFYISNIGIDRNNIKTAISNRFILGDSSTQGIWATTVFCITINKKYTGITSSDTIGQRIGKFKTWLSENPVTVYYQLATPEQISLETTGELRTFEPNTIITNSLDSEMEVEYARNQTQVSQILELNKDIPLNSFKTGKIIGNPAIDAYDIIKIVDDDKEFKTLATNDLTYNGVMINTFDTQIGKEAKKENVTLTPEATFKKWAKTEIDNVEAEVRINTGNIQTVKDEMGNMYTKGQVNELVANAETGVTNTFSEAGGNNVFRNTGLWFESNDTDNPYEFWLGNVKKGKNDNAVGYNSMLLQNGTLEQEQEVPNGDYSISFYYQKLNQLCNASVVINDVEYPLESMEVKQFYTGEKDNETGEYIVQPIVVSSNHINIKFKCDVNNGVEVYDLMCNKGTVKLAYSQNQNETTTDTVNISKGITITSSNDENVKFKADYDGIRTLNKNGDVKTRFTDKGMETDEAIIRYKEQTCGTLIQEVDGQTWFTRM